MQVTKCSALALAIAAAASQQAFASAQSESEGFVEGSSASLLNRNYYFNRDFRNAAAGEQSYTEEWAHGLIGVFESGFTQGTVGVGVDAFGLAGFKLDSGEGRIGTGLLPAGDSGEAADNYSEAGAAVKVRVSNTVLKYGNQFVELPVFSTGDSRLLPEVATGTLVTSEEIEGLTLVAGRLTALSTYDQTDRDSANDGEGLKSADVFGGTYAFTDDLSASLYHSDVEDHFKKNYLNVNYVMPLSDSQSLSFDFNAYDSKDQGQELSGEVDNRAYSLAAAYAFDAHTVTLAYQRMSGDTDYVYGVDGDGTIWLNNSVQYSDFNHQDEKSWRLGYDLDLAAYGVPGLSFGANYVYGTDIDTDTNSNAKEREIDLSVGYVVQAGPAKDLSFKVKQAFYRASSDINDDVNEVRVIAEYPLNLL